VYQLKGTDSIYIFLIFSSKAVIVDVAVEDIGGYIEYLAF
jgi:hypothetical protein